MTDKPATKTPPQVRRLLRAVHRDMGYLAVGLTLVYAASGLAVNHIADWDPNFHSYESMHELGVLEARREGQTEWSADEARALAAKALTKLGVAEAPQDVYASAVDQIDVTLNHRTLHVNPLTGHVLDQGQKPRFLLRAANWLHLNRGKRAWRYIADIYAAGLLFLALSGMFMIKGTKGLLGRGAILVLIGVAIPILYVCLANSP